MLRFISPLIVSVGVCVSAPYVFADVPNNMNVQGRLTNASGEPVPGGLVIFTFKIFDAAGGGTQIWPAGPGETQTIALDTTGSWIARVGALIPLTDGVFADSSRWLEITVNDGVNPAETMPRIKLNKTPFASDQYVNTSGDVMTGQLSSPWSHDADGMASIDVQNENGADWSIGGAHTLGISSIVTGNGPESKYGLVGIADGDDGVIFSVLAQAAGASTARYSGYFYGGDFVVANPASPASGAVQLPENAISETEILNEPGITANRYAGSGIILSPSTISQNFVSVTINMPSAGYVVVEGVAHFRLEGDGACFAWVQIHETSAAAQAAGHFVLVNSTDYANSASAYTYQTIPVRRVFLKSAGTYTFYLQGNEYLSNGPNADAFVLSPSWLQATYYSTSYGAVATVASSEEAAQFANTTAVAPQSEPGGATASTEGAYLVDLRELEIKLKNAELAVERARRELVEAQLKQSGPVRNETTIAIPNR